MSEVSSKLRNLGWVLLGIACLAGFVAAVLASLYYYQVYGDHGDMYYTDDLTPVTHVVSGRRFVVPKAYIQYWRDWKSSPKTDFLMMVALWPNMAPYSQENAYLFDPKHLSIDFTLKNVRDGWTPDYDWYAI